MNEIALLKSWTHRQGTIKEGRKKKGLGKKMLGFNKSI